MYYSVKILTFIALKTLSTPDDYADDIIIFRVYLLLFRAIIIHYHTYLFVGRIFSNQFTCFYCIECKQYETTDRENSFHTHSFTHSQHKCVFQKYFSITSKSYIIPIFQLHRNHSSMQLVVTVLLCNFYYYCNSNCLQLLLLLFHNSSLRSSSYFFCHFLSVSALCSLAYTHFS